MIYGYKLLNAFLFLVVLVLKVKLMSIKIVGIELGQEKGNKL